MPPRRKALEQGTIGGRIYTLRVAHNLTQRELAAQMGVNRSYIAQIETGRFSPGLDALTRLATHLQVTMDFLQHAGEPPRSIKRRVVEDLETLALLNLWDQAPAPARRLILRMIRVAVEE